MKTKIHIVFIEDVAETVAMKRVPHGNRPASIWQRAREAFLHKLKWQPPGTVPSRDDSSPATAPR